MGVNGDARCGCGLPLHYTSPILQHLIEEMVTRLGPEITVHTSAGVWRVPRHYIALHGLAEPQLRALAARYGWQQVDDMKEEAVTTTTTRAEHVAWCKQRALEYVDRGELANALASLVSDLGKHEDTRGEVLNQMLMAMGADAVTSNDATAMRHLIEGTY